MWIEGFSERYLRKLRCNGFIGIRRFLEDWSVLEVKVISSFMEEVIKC